MFPIQTQYSFKDCENKILDIMNDWPREVGQSEVENQRNYLAGVIDTWFDCEKITEQIRAILHSIYFEGWDRYETFAFYDVELERFKTVS